MAPFFENIYYNEKNKYLNGFICIAYSYFNIGQFDDFWKKVMKYYISDKESFMRIRDDFNYNKIDEGEKCLAYFWLNTCCTSALVRWNKNKIEGNQWYFNQAYNGKVLKPEIVKETLLDGLKSIKGKKYHMTLRDYSEVDIIGGALLLVDPPYDNTYNGYIPEEWDSERFIKWVEEKSKTNPICLFGSTKTDDFSDTKNLKPFYDAGWKVLILSEKAFNGVAPKTKNVNNQDRSKQRDVMLYNF